MKKKEKIIIVVTLVCMILTVLVGLTYAYWTKTAIQEGVNTIESSCFKIEFSDENDISLEKSYPISDEVGESLKPYTFTISNVCDEYAIFQINLESISQGEDAKVMPDQYIKSSLKQGNITTRSNVLVDDIRTTPKLSVATSAYKLYSGFLYPEETRTYDLRIWIDKDTPLIEDVQNASYMGKITIDFSYAEDPKENAGDMGRYFFQGSGVTTSKITKLVFQNELKPIENVPSYDASLRRDGSVMSYAVDNGNDTYTVYIQGNGGVYAPEDCTYLFDSYRKVEQIEGMEFFYTSKVKNMSFAFAYIENLEYIDLSHMDTSNVTNMGSMFRGLKNLKEIDVSNFETSKVTGMYYMFAWSNLEKIDLSSFDTSSLTSARNLLYESNVKVLNLSNWNFNSVEYKRLDNYFGGYRSLEKIILNNVDTSEITNMSQMFDSCENLKSIELTSFDTGNVTDMHNMFSRTLSLSSLDLSSFDTSSLTNAANLIKDSNIETLNLSNWNFNNISNQNLSGFFASNAKLKTIIMENVNTSEITNMAGMFAGCTNLNSLTLSLDSSNVTNFASMFSGVGLDVLNPSLNIGTLNIGKPGSTNSYILNTMFNQTKNVYGVLNFYKIPSAENIFLGTTVLPGKPLVLNYTEETESFVDTILSTATDSNIVKGTLLT